MTPAASRGEKLPVSVLDRRRTRTENGFQNPMTADIQLLNFPPLTLERARARYDVRRHETPGILMLNDVVCHPDYDCLFDLDGNRIPASRRVNIPPDMAPPHVVDRDNLSSVATEPAHIDIPVQMDVVEHPVLFLGAVWAHYGHYIIDSMSRFWALDHLTDMPGLLLVRPPVRQHGKAYINEVQQRLGVVEPRVISPSVPTVLRHVHMARPAFCHTFRSYGCHADPHVRVAQSILDQHGAGDSPSKIYLTRSQLKVHERQAVQEGELEERLRTEGFTIIAPERLSFVDQVRLFNRAEWIVGTIGSALHTSLFCLPNDNRQLFILAWEKINPRYLMIDEIKQQRTTYLKSMSIDAIDARDRISDTSIDIEMTMAALRASGALR